MHCGITIDSPATRDRDDAVWVTHDARGWALTVYIANVAAAIPKDSPFDRAAFSRVKTTEIEPGRMQPMLPRRFSENMCSLNEGREREVMTLHIRLDHDFTVETALLSETTLVNAKQFTYDDALAALSDSSKPYHRIISRLAQLAEGLAKRRGIPFTSPSARRVIQELMTLANHQLAHYSSRHGVHVLYCHRSMQYDILPDGAPYLHGTSPIRRYVDLVNQRQWRAWLQGKPSPYERSELAELAGHVNQAIARAADPVTQRWDRGRFSTILRRAIRADVVNFSIAQRFRLFVDELAAADLHAALFDSATAWEDLRRFTLEHLCTHPHLAMSIVAIARQKNGWSAPKFRARSSGGPDGIRHFAQAVFQKPNLAAASAQANSAKRAKHLTVVGALYDHFDIPTPPSFAASLVQPFQQDCSMTGDQASPEEFDATRSLVKKALSPLLITDGYPIDAED